MRNGFFTTANMWFSCFFFRVPCILLNDNISSRYRCPLNKSGGSIYEKAVMLSLPFLCRMLFQKNTSHHSICSHHSPYSPFICDKGILRWRAASISAAQKEPRQVCSMTYPHQSKWYLPPQASATSVQAMILPLDAVIIFSLAASGSFRMTILFPSATVLLSLPLTSYVANDLFEAAWERVRPSSHRRHREPRVDFFCGNARRWFGHRRYSKNFHRCEARRIHVMTAMTGRSDSGLCCGAPWFGWRAWHPMPTVGCGGRTCSRFHPKEVLR